MRIIIDAENARDLAKKVADVAKLFGLVSETISVDTQLKLPLVTSPDDATRVPPKETEVKTGVKRGRPRKEASPEIVAAEEPEEKSEHSVSDIKNETPSPAKPTFDDVRAALKKVSAEKGIEKCQDLLKQFEAERISALKEDHYPKFIKACDLALG